jgi:hypothetical protein
MEPTTVAGLFLRSEEPMRNDLELQQCPPIRVRSSDRPWLAVVIVAMALGAVALGAFTFGLGGGLMQTASTTPAPMSAPRSQ